jgi:peptidyl-prolyl cis-trans isomerase D
MIRILQQNNKATKVIFAVIIGFAVVTMVITLVPGIFDSVGSSSDPNTFATVHEPGFIGKVFGETETVTRPEIARAVQQQMQGRQVPPYLMPYFESQAGNQLVQLAILKIEGDRRGLEVSDEDLRRVLHQGQFGQVLFPGGNYIGDDKYMDFIQNQFGMTRGEFEGLLKKEIEQGRLQSLITGGVTVSDNEVRDSYRTSGTKVKFDYAVLSSDDISKTLNPSDSDLQTFFKNNAPRYVTAIGESRKLQYLSFGIDQVPGGKPQVTDAEVQAYYNSHLPAYTVKEQVKARHILISVPQGADAKTDAAAKAKAEDLLKQIKAGGNFAALAAANSDDPGSKTTGGELGTFTRGKMVPEFEKAAFSLQPGQTSDPVKTSFGYHLIQVESKDAAHTKTVDEVKGEILPLLQQQKLGTVEQNFANTLAAEAKKDGIEKTAAAHNLHAITTDYLAKDGTIAGVSDGTAMLSQAFTTNKGAAPAVASTGDGFAIFQVLDVKAPHAPTFDEYKSHILADYREQQVPQMLVAQLSKLAERAKALNDLHKAAAEMNIPVKSSDLVGKDGQVPDLGAMSGQASVAFTLAKGAISGPINTGRIGSVLQLTDKQEPSADDIAKNLGQTRETMLNSKRSEVFNIYLGTLTDKYKKAGAIRIKAAPATPGAPLGN